MSSRGDAAKTFSYHFTLPLSSTELNYALTAKKVHMSLENMVRSELSFLCGLALPFCSRTYSSSSEDRKSPSEN